MHLFHSLLIVILGFNSFAYYMLLSELKENSLLARSNYIAAYFKNGFMVLGALYGIYSIYKHIGSEFLNLDLMYYSHGEQFMFQLSLDTLWVLVCILISAFLASFFIIFFERLYYSGFMLFLKKTKFNLEHSENSQPIYPMITMPTRTLDSGKARQGRAAPNMAAQEAIAKMELEKKKKT